MFWHCFGMPRLYSTANQIIFDLPAFGLTYQKRPWMTSAKCFSSSGTTQMHQEKGMQPPGDLVWGNHPVATYFSPVDSFVGKERFSSSDGSLTKRYYILHKVLGCRYDGPRLVHSMTASRLYTSQTQGRCAASAFQHSSTNNQTPSEISGRAGRRPAIMFSIAVMWVSLWNGICPL